MEESSAGSLESLDRSWLLCPRKSKKSDFVIFMLGKFVWGVGWRARGANAVYVAFAMLCVHLGLFQPPKAAGILGVDVCGRLVKKRKWESHIFMGFELGGSELYYS